jgi:biotin carboxyl carrier protein
MNRHAYSAAVVCATALFLRGADGDVAAAADSTAQTLVVARGDLQLVARASGAIAWSTVVPVPTPMAGRIDQLNIAEGQLLRQGECAVVISSPQRAVLMDVARADGPEELEKWAQVYQPVPVGSPCDGTAIQVAVVAGQSIDSEQRLFSVGDILVARLYVEEMDVPLVVPGGSAELAIDALPNLALTGTVARVGSQPTPYRNAVAYEVDVAVADWPATGKAGMSLSATFPGPTSENTLIVPCTAIVRREGQTMVGRTTTDGTIEFQAVQIGLSDGVDAEIRTGLQEGDRILTDAALMPKPASTRQSRYSPLLPFKRNP